jgi:hypothetical protein
MTTDCRKNIDHDVTNSPGAVVVTLSREHTSSTSGIVNLIDLRTIFGNFRALDPSRFT